MSATAAAAGAVVGMGAAGVGATAEAPLRSQGLGGETIVTWVCVSALSFVYHDLRWLTNEASDSDGGRGGERGSMTRVSSLSLALGSSGSPPVSRSRSSELSKKHRCLF
jgi:hypothetical protein